MIYNISAMMFFYFCNKLWLDKFQIFNLIQLCAGFVNGNNMHLPKLKYKIGTIFQGRVGLPETIIFIWD